MSAWDAIPQCEHRRRFGRHRPIAGSNSAAVIVRCFLFKTEELTSGLCPRRPFKQAFHTPESLRASGDLRALGRPTGSILGRAGGRLSGWLSGGWSAACRFLPVQGYCIQDRNFFLASGGI